MSRGLAPGPVDLADPDWFLGDAVHETFAELRRTDPVHWQPMDGEPGYWAVLRYADAVEVARHPEVYSSWRGGIMIEDVDEERLALTRRMLLVMDAPQHTAYRQPLAPHFGARVVGRMEEQIRGRCRAILDAAGEQGDVDVCRDVAGPLPAQVMGEIMGLPPEDTARIRRWAEVQLGGQDGEVVGGYDGNAMLDMVTYGMELAASRRAAPPREDVTALLLESTFEDGHRMDDAEFGGFFVQLVTAGNDTTKTLVSSGVYELLRRPDQLRLLRDDPSLIPGAVEEMLRFCNPVHYQRRTALIDTTLGATRVQAGDKVAIYYTSANRDDDVFPDAQSFDVRRMPNQHLSFGIGAHFCLGAQLARLEARVLFEELLATFPTIELTGDPVRIRSNFINGYKRVPVRLGR
ncbi:MAG TPA: cytochrome P450 [Acidimicrobiia bacterium]|nr:cytochrome P450 [Acidimicrobiia bacterium]